MTKICGVEIAILDRDTLIQAIEGAVERSLAPRVLVGFYPALSLRMLVNSGYRRLLAASYCYPDGMGVVWLLRLAGEQVSERLATTDIIWPVLDRAAERGWRVVLYGGAREVVECARTVVQDRCPGVRVVAAFDGYRHVSAEEIHALDAHLIIVARGAPLQEIWSFSTAVPARVPVVMTAGGLFDFISGRTPRAPVWMRRRGLEWAYRVWKEPRRLAWRYLVGNPLCVLWTMVDWGRRSF